VRITIYWKMMIGFAVVILLMTAASAYVVVEMQGAAVRTRATLTQDVRSIDVARQMQSLLYDEERYGQKYLVSGDTAYLALFVDTGTLFNHALDSLPEAPRDPALLRLREEVDRRHAWHFTATAGDSIRRLPAAARIRAATDRARFDTLDGLDRSLSSLIRAKQRSMGASMAAVEESAIRSANLALGVTLGTLLAAVALALLITRTITRPINTLVKGTEQVARGSFAQIAVLSRDEIGRLATAFNAMSASLNRMNALRAEMLQHISHEIRMPLQTMHSAHFLLAEQQVGPLNEDQIRLLVSIRENIDKITRFNNQFLDLSRIEAGMMEYHFAPVDLELLVERVIEDARIIAARKGIVISFEPRTLPPVRADAEKCSTVFSNLVGNAIKYTERGGAVSVVLSRNSTGARCSVSDSGEGIAQEDLPKIFTKFYRTKSAVKGRTKGTGIGLALVKAFVEGHGGRINVESRVGIGSTFVVDLPLWEQSPQETRS
jgi:two-component system sensor histidine kinase GlrK